MDPTAEQTAWYAAKVGTVAVVLTCGGGTVRGREISRDCQPRQSRQTFVNLLETVFR